MIRLQPRLPQPRAANPHLLKAEAGELPSPSGLMRGGQLVAAINPQSLRHHPLPQRLDADPQTVTGNQFTLRATWRGLETWNGRDTSADRRASPRPYLREAGGEIPLAYYPYIPMAKGFVYLVAVMDWFSRRVLSWRLSITMEADFCVSAATRARKIRSMRFRVMQSTTSDPVSGYQRTQLTSPEAKPRLMAGWTMICSRTGASAQLPRFPRTAFTLFGLRQSRRYAVPKQL